MSKEIIDMNGEKQTIIYPIVVYENYQKNNDGYQTNKVKISPSRIII
jgi:hypothetical protein